VFTSPCSAEVPRPVNGALDQESAIRYQVSRFAAPDP
jgi:hypothetical protein